LKKTYLKITIIYHYFFSQQTAKSQAGCKYLFF
jgi:hypothetical protein